MKFLNYLKRKVSSGLPIGGGVGSVASDSAYQWGPTQQKLTDAEREKLLEAVTWAKEKIDTRYQQLCEYHGYIPVTTIYGVRIEDLDKEDLVKMLAIITENSMRLSPYESM